MCEPTTIAYGVAALVGGYAASRAMAPDIPQAAPPPAAATPPAPTPVTPPPAAPKPAATQARQAPKSPAVQQLRAANGAATTGRNAGQSATMLTGPSGVDLGTLPIGRNTLLGQ